MRNLNRDVEPFSRFGPSDISDIELIFRRLNNVIKTIVNRVVELRIRNIDSLLYTKFVLVKTVWPRGARATCLLNQQQYPLRLLSRLLFALRLPNLSTMYLRLSGIDLASADGRHREPQLPHLGPTLSRWPVRSVSLSGMSVSSETRFTRLSHSLTVGSSSRSSMAATLPNSDFSFIFITGCYHRNAQMTIQEMVKTEHRLRLLGLFFGDQSALAMRIGARLASAKFALLTRSGSASWTADCNRLLEAECLFHVEIMPQYTAAGMVNLDQGSAIITCLIRERCARGGGRGT
jgi:hypothetical protein